MNWRRQLIAGAFLPLIASSTRLRNPNPLLAWFRNMRKTDLHLSSRELEPRRTDFVGSTARPTQTRAEAAVPRIYPGVRAGGRERWGAMLRSQYAIVFCGAL